MVDGHSITISVELFSINQVDFEKKIFKVIPIFTFPGGDVFQHIKTIWTFLAEPHPIIIYAKSFSNPSVSISHDAMGFSAVCDCGISLHTHLLSLTKRLA